MIMEKRPFERCASAIRQPDLGTESLLFNLPHSDYTHVRIRGIVSRIWPRGSEVLYSRWFQVESGCCTVLTLQRLSWALHGR